MLCEAGVPLIVSTVRPRLGRTGRESRCSRTSNDSSDVCRGGGRIVKCLACDSETSDSFPHVASVGSIGAVQPEPGNDYGRPSLGGSQGMIEWESLLQGEDLEGWEVNGQPWSTDAWRREGDIIVAQVADL